MEAVIDDISRRLRAKWVLLITKMKLLKHPRARYDIESRHDEKSSDFFSNCGRDAIHLWMQTQGIKDLEDREKIQILMSELHKIDDFKPIVEAINQEGYDIAVTTAGVLGGASNDQETGHVGVPVECTTRSATLDHIQAREYEYTSAPTVTPLVSQADVSSIVPWSYGDAVSELPGREGGASLHSRVSLTPDSSESESVRSKPHMDTSGIGDVTNPQSSLSLSDLAGLRLEYQEDQNEHRPRQQSFFPPTLGFSDKSDSKASSISDDIPLEATGGAQGYDTIIDITGNKRHLFSVLDAVQRLPYLEWTEVGARLGLERAFLSSLAEEEPEEKYYLMIKKWIERCEGTATFTALREIFQGFQADTAMLVLSARLEGDGEVSIRAIERDLL